MFSKIFIFFQYYIFKYRYCLVKKRLRRKEQINIAFFIIHASVWKLDELYKRFQLDKRFNPVVFICPCITFDEVLMINEMNEVEQLLIRKKYKYVNTYNRENNNWVNVRKEFHPDIVFFTNPYFGITKKEYYITNYKSSLNCYVPYSYTCDWLYDYQYNQALSNLVWRYFLESDISKKLSKKHSFVNGRNAIVTGFPSLDVLFDKEYIPNNAWKHSQSYKLIWAPHHSIGELGNEAITFSTFLQFSDCMIAVAEKYKDQVQIAFKPHPILKSKLYKHAEWGQKRTDEYYQLWDTMENTQLESSDYIDLFKTSDAMIFDSVSFITEYLYVKKPALFLCREGVEEQLNEMGKMSCAIHYKGYCENDIYNFVDNNILNGIDTQYAKRESFYNDYLLLSNNRTASDNIYQEIEKTITKIDFI